MEEGFFSKSSFSYLLPIFPSSKKVEEIKSIFIN